ncbi:MAG: NAD-dependent epimerase/dehydratase family protein [Chthonomonadales bacterium]|nr:NAD-dependent epimerase/dehydratase family protein [Chthonomonadales bacterium]
MKHRSVLVSGGAGFIGSHLVHRLVREGARVRVLDNLSTGSVANLSGLESRLDLQEGDIRNAVACRNACRGVEAVFHLAAFISVPGSVKDPVTADAVNIGGTLNMLLAARDAGARRFVFSSSAAVYGDAEVVPTPETAPPTPLSPYGVEKLYGEHMCRLFTSLYGMEAVALRYFNVFGPRQNPRSEYAAVVPRFITLLLEGARPVIFGDGAQTRDFLHVEDVARANLLAATRPDVAGLALNVAGGEATSVNAIYDAIARAAGVDLPPERGPERPGDIKHSRADTTHARERLGFVPERTVARGLAETVAWYRAAASM